MATNGSFIIYENSSTRIKFTWSRSSYNVKDLTSVINWKLAYERLNNDTTYHFYTYNMSIDGKVYSGTIDNSSKSSISGTQTIKHYADGTRSFVYKCTLKYSDSIAYSEVSTYFTLNHLPLAAEILIAPNFNDEENPTITYSNPSYDLVSSLAACISFTGTKDDIAYRDIPKDKGTYTFELTPEERAVLRAKITSGDSITVRFYVRTIREDSSGAVYTYSVLERTLTLINHTPSLNPSVIDSNNRTIELTGNNKKFIRYFSTASYNTGAAARKEAYIESQQIINGTKTIYIEDQDQRTGTIEAVDSNTFYFNAIDNRGFQAKDFEVVDLIPYVKLTGSLILYPMSASGNLTFKVKGNYYNGSFGAKSNNIQFSYGIRENDGDISWVNIDPYKQGSLSFNENTYEFTYNISGLNYESTYTLTVSLEDALSDNIQLTADSVSSSPVFDWGNNDFNFNVPVYVKKNMGLRVIDNDGNDVSVFNPCNPTGNCVIGWGGYDKANGDTILYGKRVGFNSKEGVYINGRAYGSQKILWQSTGWYMNGTQIANLSEAISSQPNGIILVFSLYRNGAAENASIHSFFVSKKEVELLPNAPHTFFMMINSGFSVIGAKYLYIDDTKITGHDTNSTAGSNNNMTYKNDNFVLRYVIGV